MAGIGARDTRPEHAVRRYLHAAGLRFRLHGRKLPGRPDLVFPARKTVVFVHGCFWHRHVDCRFATTPTTRPAFWQHKFSSNVDRDLRVAKSLRSMGWRVLVVWECEARNELALDRLFWRIVSV